MLVPSCHPCFVNLPNEVTIVSDSGGAIFIWNTCKTLTCIYRNCQSHRAMHSEVLGLVLFCYSLPNNPSKLKSCGQLNDYLTVETVVTSQTVESFLYLKSLPAGFDAVFPFSLRS